MPAPVEVATKPLPSNTEPVGTPFVVGDSLGVGVQNAGRFGGTAVKGAQPQAVIGQIENAANTGRINGQDVILSSGVSNDPAHGLQWVSGQIAALKAGGAKSITLLGVGDRPDLAPLNAQLAAIAKQNGVEFRPVDPATLADHVHPKDYGYLTGNGTSAAPADKPPVDVPGSDKYATASPPPNAGMQLVVQSAAKKYGVPDWVANWVGTHESGWDTGATGPATSHGNARGAWQFMDGTAKQYGVTDPTDFGQATDGAMHYLSDLYKKHGNWADAIAEYGTFSTGQGAERDAAVRAGFVKYAANVGGENAGGMPPPGPGARTRLAQAQNVTSSPPPEGGPGAVTPEQRTQLQQVGLPFPDYKGMTEPSGMAKAIGIMAFLKGDFGTAARIFDPRQMQLEANRQVLDDRYRTAMLGNAINRTDLMGNSALGKPVIMDDGHGGQMVVQPLRNGQFMPLPGATPDVLRATNTATPEGNQRMVAASEEEKLAQKEIAALPNTTALDEQSVKDAQSVLAEIDKHPEINGSTWKAQFTRYLTQAGLLGDPNDIDAILKGETQARNAGLKSIMNNAMGSLRSAQEVKMLGAAFADLGTNPEAAKWIMRQTLLMSQAKQEWDHVVADQMAAHPDYRTSRDLFGGQSYAAAKETFMRRYFEQHPIPAYGSGVQGQQGIGGQKPTLRYDQNTGQMVPMQ
jgi:hypothetical protein